MYSRVDAARECFTCLPCRETRRGCSDVALFLCNLRTTSVSRPPGEKERKRHGHHRLSIRSGMGSLSLQVCSTSTFPEEAQVMSPVP